MMQPIWKGWSAMKIFHRSIKWERVTSLALAASLCASYLLIPRFRRVYVLNFLYERPAFCFRPQSDNPISFQAKPLSAQLCLCFSEDI